MFKFVKNFFKKKNKQDWESFAIRINTPLVWDYINTEPKPVVKLRKANKTSFKKGHTPWNKGKKKGK